MTKNKLFFLLLIFTLVFSMSFVAAVDRQITINAGSLDLEAPTLGNFSAVTLTGVTQTVTLDSTGGTITDATGSGSGWVLKVGATQFTNGTHVLTRGAFELTTVPGLTLIDPNSSETNSITMAAANGEADQITPVTVFRADKDGGMGSYNIGNHQFSLTLMPKETYSGTYTSTITYTLQAVV